MRKKSLYINNVITSTVLFLQLPLGFVFDYRKIALKMQMFWSYIFIETTQLYGQENWNAI